MSGLSRNARRRVALYGGGAFVLLAAWAVPLLVSHSQPAVAVRRYDVEAAAAMDTPEVKLLTEVVRLDTRNPPGSRGP